MLTYDYNKITDIIYKYLKNKIISQFKIEQSITKIPYTYFLVLSNKLDF